MHVPWSQQLRPLQTLTILAVKQVLSATGMSQRHFLAALSCLALCLVVRAQSIVKRVSTIRYSSSSQKRAPTLQNIRWTPNFPSSQPRENEVIPTFKFQRPTLSLMAEFVHLITHLTST